MCSTQPAHTVCNTVSLNAMHMTWPSININHIQRNEIVWHQCSHDTVCIIFAYILLLSDVTCPAFRVYRTHDLGIARVMLYFFSYRLYIVFLKTSMHFAVYSELVYCSTKICETRGKPSEAEPSLNLWNHSMHCLFFFFPFFSSRFFLWMPYVSRPSWRPSVSVSPKLF